MEFKGFIASDIRGLHDRICTTSGPKLTARAKLTFDERFVLYRVVSAPGTLHIRPLASALKRPGYKLKSFKDLYPEPEPDSGLELSGLENVLALKMFVVHSRSIHLYQSRGSS